MSYSASILHMSDLHFGNNSRFNNRKPEELGRTCAKAVLNELKKLRMNDKPDLIIITGDITQMAIESEFSDAEKFFRALGEDCKVQNSQFIFMPGNHDISWKRCEAYFSSYPDRKELPYDPDLALKKLELFNQFKNSFYGTSAPPCIPLIRGSELYDIDDLHISIAAINSCERETHQYHLGFVSSEQAKAIMDHWRNNLKYKDCIKIAALHHPINSKPDKIAAWQKVLNDLCSKGELTKDLLDRFYSDAVSVGGNEFINSIIEDCNVHVVLHGHQHSYADPQPHPWDPPKVSCHICPTGSFGLNPKKLPVEQPNCMRLLHFFTADNALQLKTVSLEYDPLERQKGEVHWGCFRNTGRNPFEVNYPVSDNFKNKFIFSGLRNGIHENVSSVDLSSGIKDQIVMILEDNEELCNVLSGIFKTSSDPAENGSKLISDRLATVWGLTLRQLNRLISYLDDFKKILLLLAGNEAKGAVAHEVRSKIDIRNRNGNIIITCAARYALTAEIILATALDREMHVELISDNGKYNVHPTNILELNKNFESGMTGDERRNHHIKELLKKFDLDTVPVEERIPRLSARLEGCLNSKEPLAVIHYENNIELGIKYLIEFILPHSSQTVALDSVTNIAEDTLLEMIKNILVKIHELQKRGH